MAESITLWTIQPPEAVRSLERWGFLRTDGRRVDRNVREPYQWLATQMRRRGIHHPSATYPLWAWFQFDYWGVVKRRPDLRTGGFAPRGTKLVLLEIEVASDRVLLSDFEFWHYPLNFWYLPNSADDRARFERQYPEPPGAIIECRQRSSAARRRRIESSWTKIFDLDWPGEDGEDGGRERKSIQATFWELRTSDVRSTRAFVAR